MGFNMYVKWRLAAIAAVLIFLSLPSGMDLSMRVLLSVGLGSTPLSILPSGGGFEPEDDELPWSQLFLSWPMLSFYFVLGTFVWWLDGALWSCLIAASVCLIVLVFRLLCKGSFELMKETHSPCL